MIKRSDTWQKVKEKQDELRNLVNQKLVSGEWEVVEMGEKTLKTVEESRLSAYNMVYKTNRYLETVEHAEKLAARLSVDNQEVKEI